ncbi:MAG: oligosaccharide flippase family protein [Clostridia bacterium]|nr:oligosaccharide flippase family protein [Clostridia bacterium]
MKIIKNKLLGGALVLSVCGVITKLIGAFYRVPLTNILGAEGMGLYQMVFPLYTILLTFSSTGAPSGISKLIASGEKPENALKSALKLFSIMGLLGSFLMAIFCYPISKLQGNYLAWILYLLLSPSVFLVSVISCFRGYFQGLVNMKPTGVSQIIEQVVKLGLGLILLAFIKGETIIKTSACVLAVTVSELIALLWLLIVYKKHRKVPLKNAKSNVKSVVKTVVPMMLSSVVMPLIRTVDSFLILNVIKTNATGYYGLYSGVVESLVGVPVTVCYSLALTSIPIIAKLKTSLEKCNKSLNVVALTGAISSIMAVAVYIFSDFIINLLYGGLNLQDKLVSINMLKISSLSVILLPIMQSGVASLNAMGKAKISILALIISGAIKIITSYILLSNSQIGVYGAIYGDISCYFVACFIILGYIIYIKLKGKRNERNYRNRAWSNSERLVGGG